MAAIATGNRPSFPLNVATMIGKGIDKASQISGQISGILIIISCVCIFVSIVMRALGLPTAWSFEITIYCMMWFISLALSFTQSKKGNINLDLFIGKFSEKKQEVLMAAAYLMSLIFSTLFAVYAFRMFSTSLAINEKGAYFLSVDLWWVKLAFFVGTLMLSIQIIRMLVSQCRILYLRSKENGKELRTSILTTIPIFAVLLVVALYLISVSQLVGMLALLFVLLIFGVPIGFTLGLVGASGLYILFSGTASLAAVTVQAYSHLNSFIFAALPLYIFAGQIMHSGKLAEKFFRVGSSFLGHLPGGLGIATIFACALFAAINGSSAANCATIGLIAIPELMKYGYSKAFACGIVAAGGTLGILIPPSNGMILIAAQTGESAGKLFMAGLIPGIILAILYMAATLVSARGYKTPSFPPATWKERGVALKEAVWVLLLPVIILVPIYTGIFTVTESAAVAVIYALAVGLIQRTIKLSDLKRVLGEATTSTGMIFCIILGALVLGYLVTRLQGPQHLVQYIMASNLPGWVFIFAMVILLLILGLFLDGVAINMMIIPMMILPLQTFGFSMIWFAVLFVMSMEMGQLTPPVAINIFIVQRIAKAQLTTVLSGLRWYYVVILATMILVALVPILSLWIPNHM
jgi:C4-dicarboxylate transporter, DctM subunit